MAVINSLRQSEWPFTEYKHSSLYCEKQAIYEGWVYKDDGSGLLTPITGKADTAIAIAVSSSLDPQYKLLGKIQPLVLDNGSAWEFEFINSHVIIGVASDAGITYKFGDIIFLSNQNAGMVANSHNSSRPIGHYVGPQYYTTSSTAGDLINVYLDLPIESPLI